MSSNQGFESVIIESEDLNSDPLPLKTPLIQSQDSNIKTRVKKSSKTLGVRQLFDELQL
jgi:hypothetical protein